MMFGNQIDDYAFNACPVCKSKLRIEYTVSVDVDIDVEAHENKTKYPQFLFSELREAPAFVVDTAAIPFTADQTSFYPPVIHAGWEWWTNGCALYRGRPLAVMHMSTGDNLPEVNVHDLLTRFTGDCVACVPARADDYRVLMSWGDGDDMFGVILRSTVEICARRWLDGQWYVQRKTPTGALHNIFSFWVDGEVVCISTGFYHDKQWGGA